MSAPEMTRETFGHYYWIFRTENTRRGLLHDFEVGPHTFEQYKKYTLPRHIQDGEQLKRRAAQFVGIADILGSLAGSHVVDERIPYDTKEWFLEPEQAKLYMTFSEKLSAYSEAVLAHEGDTASVSKHDLILKSGREVCQVAYANVWGAANPELAEAENRRLGDLRVENYLAAAASRDGQIIMPHGIQ